MKQKILSIISTLILSVGMLQAAVETGTCGTNLTWSLNTKDSTLTITGTGKMTNNPSWSSYVSYIKYVSLPNGLTNISIYAFGSCTNLLSITIPNSVTSIDTYAFRDCSSLSEIVIPNNVTTIDDGVFAGCTNLHSVILPDNLLNFGNGVIGVFSGCSNLKTINLPNTMTSINSNTFSNSGLVYIEIPNNVNNIGGNAFYNCSNLTSIHIPSGVTYIGNQAFSHCTGLTSITCDAVTPPSLGNGAFYDVNKSIPLFVPVASIETYANTIIWEEFTNIIAIGTVIGTFRVEFHDLDDTILKVDSVNYGSSATAPANPYREGYTFIGWDVDFSNITSDLIVTAQYDLGEEKDFTIIFAKGNDNNEILSHNVILKVPAAPQITGFTFIGWRPIAAIIESNTIEIEAVYQADEPSAIPSEVTNPANSAQKLIRDGNVYILKDDKLYTITGNVL